MQSQDWISLFRGQLKLEALVLNLTLISQQFLPFVITILTDPVTTNIKYKSTGELNRQRVDKHAMNTIYWKNTMMMVAEWSKVLIPVSWSLMLWSRLALGT